MEIKSCIVLGGGIAGLTIADRLSQKGVRVTLLEKQASLGGLCRGITVGKGRVDLGPHILRAPDRRILDYWKELLGDDLLEPNFSAKILFNNRLFSFPIKVFDLLRTIPPKELSRYAFDVLKARLRSGPPPESLEDWLVGGYGRRLYDLFFEPLTNKIWGVSPSRLDAKLGQQRIPRIPLWRTLMGKPSKERHSQDPTAHKYYFPKYGVFEICERIVQRLENSGVELRISAEISRIVEDHNGWKVEVTSKGVNSTLTADYLVSSIPISTLVGLMSAIPPKKFHYLKYRGAGFQYLSVPDTDMLPEPIINCADKNLPFNRVTDFYYFSRAMFPAGTHVICVEFQADSSDDAYLRHRGFEIIESLKQCGLLRLEKIYEIKYEYVSTVYPIYLRGYQDELKATLLKLGALNRLLTIGRQGLYSHINVDQSMLSAFRAAEIMATTPFQYSAKKEFYTKQDETN